MQFYSGATGQVGRVSKGFASGGYKYAIKLRIAYCTLPDEKTVIGCSGPESRHSDGLGDRATFLDICCEHGEH